MRHWYWYWCLMIHVYNFKRVQHNCKARERLWICGSAPLIDVRLDPCFSPPYLLMLKVGLVY